MSHINRSHHVEPMSKNRIEFNYDRNPFSNNQIKDSSLPRQGQGKPNTKPKTHPKLTSKEILDHCMKVSIAVNFIMTT